MSEDVSTAPTRPASWLRRSSRTALRAGAHQVLSRRRRPRARSLLRELRRLEFAAPETVAAHQRQRLKELVQWACQACPHYEEAARAAGFDPRQVERIEDLAGMPVLTKAVLRERAGRLRPVGAPQADWRLNASGGSTGEPVQLWQDANYWNEAQAAQWFTESWWNIKPGEASAWLWGADRDLAQRSWRERLSAYLLQEHALNAFAVRENELEAFARRLAQWQPPLINGYASALDLCARFLLGRPEIQVRPRAIRSTAEVLRPEERARIEAAFATPVYDQYGSREANNLASECPAHQGLHVNCWSRVIELVDGQGRAVPPGVPGRVLVTDLSNRATALIRYENGDIGEWQGRACACGRPFPLLARIVGRKSDFIHTPEGKLIHGEYFTHLFYEHPEVRAFQVVQESLGALRVEVELAEGEMATLAAALEPRVAEAMGLAVRIEFRRVAGFERSASGKHRFTRSSLDLPWKGEGS